MNLISHDCHSYLHITLANGIPPCKTMVMAGENAANHVDEESLRQRWCRDMRLKKLQLVTDAQSPMRIKPDSLIFLVKRKQQEHYVLLNRLQTLRPLLQNYWVQTIRWTDTDTDTEPRDVTDQTLLRRARSQEHFSADSRKVYCARFVDAKLKGLTCGAWLRGRRVAASGTAAVEFGDTFSWVPPGEPALRGGGDSNGLRAACHASSTSCDVIAHMS